MMPLDVRQPAVVGPPVVLLVEDHLDSRALYAFDLNQFGFRVEEADSAAQAMQRVATITPDVVVADVALPDCNGLKLCETLKASEPTKGVPIIALTAYADAETAKAAREAGCAAVLVKPCASDHLRAEIVRALAACSKTRLERGAAVEGAPSPPERAPISTERRIAFRSVCAGRQTAPRS
jgi:CheY-like chemotaxis protein